ncbi:MAG: sensor histidine kinase [Pirellulaceae bacterium]
MRLQNIITLPSAAIGLVLLILSIAGSWYVLRLQRLNSQVLDVNVSSIRAAAEIDIIVREMRHQLERFLLTDDHGHLRRASEMQHDLAEWLEQARVWSMSEHEVELVAALERGLDDFFARLEQVLQTPGDSSVPVSIESLAEDVLTARVLVIAREYLTFNEQALHDSNQQNKAMARRLAIALLFLGTAGAIGGLAAGYAVARGISRTLFQLSVPIRNVAGKLDEFVGPVELSVDPSIADLETGLQMVSTKVGAVVEQLYARRREVIRADQLAAVGQLAAGLAHELRNPLMCMKTLVQSAKRRGDVIHFDLRDLTVLDEEISRLETLLQAFLDFARPATPDTHAVDVARLVDQTVRFVSRKAEARNVTITCRLPEQPLVVEADDTQLRQVILNLLLNALDAVQNGGQIWIEAGLLDNRLRSNGRSHPQIRLRVADNGRGLPTQNRGRIFEPFFSTKETGLGLGLAISQRIIDAHGGELLALDREGGGAIFEVQLPLRARVASIVT